MSATLTKMWRAFYRNFGKTMRSAPLDQKVKLLHRAVLPVASYRMSRWPYQAYSAGRIDRAQRKMIGILLRVRMRPGEDPATFGRRRNREATVVTRQHGTWSAHWRKRVIDWNAHLSRDQNHKSWASKTLHYHGQEWLRDQRRINAFGEQSSFTVGRTCTCASRGVVHKRWHDGVDTALGL